MMKRWLPAVLVSVSILVAPALATAARCPDGVSSQGAMWLSIAHPGLGEAKVEGGNFWKALPKKKFWYGFIPVFGWPGYLQVKSAVDASRCKSNDEMFGWS